MRFWDIAILVCVAAALLLAVRSLFRPGRSGCTGCCSACRQNCHKEARR